MFVRNEDLRTLKKSLYINFKRNDSPVIILDNPFHTQLDLVRCNGWGFPVF